MENLWTACLDNGHLNIVLACTFPCIGNRNNCRHRNTPGAFELNDSWCCVWEAETDRRTRPKYGGSVLWNYKEGEFSLVEISYLKFSGSYYMATLQKAGQLKVLKVQIIAFKPKICSTNIMSWSTDLIKWDCSNDNTVAWPKWNL